MRSTNTVIADVQSQKDCRNIPINEVGIKDIKYPIRIALSDSTVQQSVANFYMAVGLPAEIKGTHMSRFIELLEENDLAFTPPNFVGFLEKILTRLNATSGRVTAKFPLFIYKNAPVSGVKGLLDYDITYSASCNNNGEYTTKITVVVPITSLCPCSKEISKYGAHNQRSHITITTYIDVTKDIFPEELITIAEEQASCQLYSLLKRSDEKYVTEKAYDNPKFVEDLVRDVARELNKNSAILTYSVESENFESIHNHSAYAMINNK